MGVVLETATLSYLFKGIFSSLFSKSMRNCGIAKELLLRIKKMERKIRILMAKPGLDGHDRGIKVLARAYRDAGMEVIYLGLRQTPEMIVNSAIQEDVDVIALSILSGAHMTIFPKVLELMKENGLDDVLLTGGGIIPKEDIEELKKMGAGEMFGPGTPLQETIDYITNWVEENRWREEVAGEW